MKIAVLGSGAMGSLYGGKLAAAGFDVTLIDVWKAHVEAVNAVGLTIEELDGEQVVRGIKAVSRPEKVGPVDLVMVFVKAFATEEAMKGSLCLLGKDTKVLTLQNGLGNVETLCDMVGAERLVAGTTAHGATMSAPGRVRHCGIGPTVVGNISGGTDEKLRELGFCLEIAGFSVELSKNVMGIVWDKLMVNVGINALTALTGLENGRILDFPEAEEILEMAVNEAMAVAERKGVILTSSDPVAHVKDVCGLTASNRSSMLQDVTKGRRTEIDVMNGAISKEAERLGISAPVNLVLSDLVKIVQARYGGR